jgi:hypothetical protein
MPDGRWFALYAPDYTATKVMELPCKHLGGEAPASHGFCPADYYVPYDHPDVLAADDAGRFGFLAGCILAIPSRHCALKTAFRWMAIRANIRMPG